MISILTITLGDYPFVSESMAFFEGEVMKSVKKTINNAIETRRPTLVLRGVYILAAIVDGIRPLPRQIEPYILDRLRKLARILPTEDYIGTAGYEALSEYMRSIPLPDLSGKFYRERENGKRDSLCICENLGVWREIEALKNLLSK